MTVPNFQAIAHFALRSLSRQFLGLGLGLAILAVCLVASLSAGTVETSLQTVWQALSAFDGSREHLIIRTLRLPRSLLAVMVGASLGVAGAIMQGLTRNPLAEPGILGINSGAALAVVGAVFWLDHPSVSVYTSCGLLGAGVSAIAVYTLGSFGPGGLTPLKLTIAGAALSALFSSLTTTILILNQRTLDEIRFWLAGSLAGRDLNLLLQIFPYILLGLGVAIALSKALTVISLGEDVAKALGQRTATIKVLAAGCVVLLAGSSVAIAGPIGFVGLLVPHIARFLVGIDYRWILPYTAVLGGILLLVADMIARNAIAPQEFPVGVMTVFIGAPFFIYLALWKIKK